jgi:hypothetical protein
VPKRLLFYSDRYPLFIGATSHISAYIAAYCIDYGTGYSTGYSGLHRLQQLPACPEPRLGRLRLRCEVERYIHIFVTLVMTSGMDCACVGEKGVVVHVTTLG